MNTDAQRARNARKRAKLRAKHRGVESMYRTLVTADVLRWNRELQWESRQGMDVPFSKDYHKLYSTGWIVSTTFDASSSELDTINTFLCDMVLRPFPLEHTCRTVDVTLQVQYKGQERRKTWRDADLSDVAAVVAALCSFKSEMSSMELHNQEHSHALSTEATPTLIQPSTTLTKAQA